MLKINFELGQGSFSLSTDPTSTESMASLLFTKLLATFIQRPKTVAVDVALKDMVLVENLVPDSHFRELIKVKPSNPGSPAIEKPLLHASYDQMTKNPSASAEINLALRPLLVIINMIAADRLVSFLLNKQTLPLLDALKAEAKQTFDTIGVKTRANMQKALQDHKGTDLKVKIDAPVILLPEDPTNLSKALFVLDLGKLRADSELVSNEDKQKIFDRKRMLTDEEMDELQHLLFDRINLSLSQFAIYYAENVASWWSMAGDDQIVATQANKVLEQIDMHFTLQTSILSTAANLAQMKINAHVPEIILYMSDRKIEKVMSILNNLPKPSQSSPADATVAANAATAPSKKKPRRVAKPKKRENAPLSGPDEFFDAYDDTHQEVVEEAVVDDEIDPLNLVFGFTLDKICVLLGKTENLTSERSVASFTAQKLDLCIALHDLLNEIDFKIAAFSVMEHLSTADGSVIIDGSFLANNQDLLHISIKLVNPNNSDFATLYREIERSILIDISSVGISLDPDRLYPIAEFVFKDILPKLSNEESANRDEGTMDKLKHINPEEILAYQPKTEIAFTFSQFSVFLMDQDLKVGILEADGMQISVLLFGSRLVVSGDFSSFFFRGITELKPNADYKQLFYFIGDSVVKFKFETKCAETLDYFAGSNILKLSTGQLCVSFEALVIALIVSTGVKFLKIAQLASKTSESTRDIEEIASKKVDSSSSSVATYIDVDLMAPVIFIPSVDNQNIIRVNLGQLLLSNKILKVEGSSLLFDQLVDVNLNDIYIALLNSQRQTERYLLNKFRIPVTLRMTADAMKRNYADIEVDSELESILLEMNHGDYATIMRIVNEISSSINLITDALPKNDAVTLTRKEEVPNKDSSRLEPEEVPENFPFDVKMLIPNIRMRLTNMKDEPKVTLDVNGVSIMAVSHSIRGLGVEVSVESISIKDQEDPRQQFSELFCLGTAAETYNEPIVDAKRQFLVRMDKKPNGAIIVNIYVESPRVFVLFDTIFFLQSFFVLESSSPPPPKSTRPDSHSAVTDGNSMDSFTLLFNLLDASILLVQDPKSSVTETLAFRVGSLSVKFDKNIGLIIDEVSLFVFNTENPVDTKIDLIDDFSGVVSLLNDSDHNSSLLDVSLQPLSVTVSFQDLQLFQCFLTAMTEARSRYDKKIPLPAEKSTSYERSESMSAKSSEKVQ